MMVEVGSSMALREDQSKEELGALILRGLPQISGRTIAKDTGWFPSSSCVPVELAGSHVPTSQSRVINQRRELQSLSSWFLTSLCIQNTWGHLLKKSDSVYQR